MTIENHLNYKCLIPDWLECVLFSFAALDFVIGLTHKHLHKRICLANEIGVFDTLGLYQLDNQLSNWM